MNPLKYLFFNLCDHLAGMFSNTEHPQVKSGGGCRYSSSPSQSQDHSWSLNQEQNWSLWLQVQLQAKYHTHLWYLQPLDVRGCKTLGKTEQKKWDGNSMAHPGELGGFCLFYEELGDTGVSQEPCWMEASLSWKCRRRHTHTATLAIWACHKTLKMSACVCKGVTLALEADSF